MLRPLLVFHNTRMTSQFTGGGWFGGGRALTSLMRRMNEFTGGLTHAREQEDCSRLTVGGGGDAAPSVSRQSCSGRFTWQSCRSHVGRAMPPLPLPLT